MHAVAATATAVLLTVACGGTSGPAESNPETTSVKQREAPTPLRAGAPRRLVVPALGLSAPVIGVRLESGSITPPDDPRVIGWWRGGAAPGAPVGTALLTAHTVHSGGGAFDDLSTLRPGATVLVHTKRGTVRFRVSYVRVLSRSALAARATRLFDQEARGRLALVTCEDWDGEGYLSNTVVLARPVGGRAERRGR